MTHTYTITGMTCGGCVARVKNALQTITGVKQADVQLSSPQATITMQKHISTSALQNSLFKAGNYIIKDAGNQEMEMDETESSLLITYKPLLIIGTFITALTLLSEFMYPNFNTERWMQNFMAAFFLVFSFFKILDLKGFAESYSTYDIIGKKWPAWGYVYAFIELGLGIAYLLKINPLLTNTVTFLVMSISIIGVLQSVLNKRKIKCACLGAIFNLPMSSVTIIEDALMISMSAIMIVNLI